MKDKQSMLWRELKSKKNIKKKVEGYNLKFDIGIGIQNLIVIHIFTLR